MREGASAPSLFLSGILLSFPEYLYYYTQIENIDIDQIMSKHQFLKGFQVSGIEFL